MSSRFFTSTTPVFVENKMYEAPAEWMEKVVVAQDTVAENAIKRSDALENMLKSISSTKIDDPIIKQAIDDYRAKIFNATEGIYGNMDQFKKMLPELRGISSSLSNDLFAGKFKAAKENLGRQNETMKSIDGTYVDPNTKRTVSEFFDNVYKSKNGMNYNDETGNYNPYPDFKEYAFTDFVPEEEANALDLKEEIKNIQKPWIGGGISSSVEGKKSGFFEDSIITKAEAHWDASGAVDRLTTKFKMEAYNGGLKDKEDIDRYVNARLNEVKEDYITAAKARAYEKVEYSGGYSMYSGQTNQDRINEKTNAYEYQSDWTTQDDNAFINTITSGFSSVFGWNPGDVSTQLKTGLAKVGGDIGKFVDAYKTAMYERNENGGIKQDPVTHEPIFKAGVPLTRVNGALVVDSEKVKNGLKDYYIKKGKITTVTTDIYDIHADDSPSVKAEKLKKGDAISMAMFNSGNEKVFYRYKLGDQIISGYGTLNSLFPNIYKETSNIDLTIESDTGGKSKTIQKGNKDEILGKTSSEFVGGGRPSVENFSFYESHADPAGITITPEEYQEQGVFGRDAYIMQVRDPSVLPNSTIPLQAVDIQMYFDKDKFEKSESD